jgi:hypothetical protein
MRTKRRRVGRVGIFAGARCPFHRAGARRGRAGVLSWPVLKEALNTADYRRIEEGRGSILMGE